MRRRSEWINGEGWIMWREGKKEKEDDEGINWSYEQCANVIWTKRGEWDGTHTRAHVFYSFSIHTHTQTERERQMKLLSVEGAHFSVCQVAHKNDRWYRYKSWILWVHAICLLSPRWRKLMSFFSMFKWSCNLLMIERERKRKKRILVKTQTGREHTERHRQEESVHRVTEEGTSYRVFDCFTGHQSSAMVTFFVRIFFARHGSWHRWLRGGWGGGGGEGKPHTLTQTYIQRERRENTWGCRKHRWMCLACCYKQEMWSRRPVKLSGRVNSVIWFDCSIFCAFTFPCQVHLMVDCMRRTRVRESSEIASCTTREPAVAAAVVQVVL